MSESSDEEVVTTHTNVPVPGFDGDVSDEPEVGDNSPRFVRYHKEDKQLPVLANNLGQNLRQSVEIIIDIGGKVPEHLLSTNVPYRVEKNSTFIVDTRHVPFKDITKDGNGVYTQTGTRTSTLDENYNILCHKKTKNLPNGYVHMVRKTFVHSSAKDFKRKIIYLVDHSDNIVNNRVIIIYEFDGAEQDIEIKSHENATISQRRFTGLSLRFWLLPLMNV